MKFYNLVSKEDLVSNLADSFHDIFATNVAYRDKRMKVEPTLALASAMMFNSTFEESSRLERWANDDQQICAAIRDFHCGLIESLEGWDRTSFEGRFIGFSSTNNLDMLGGRKAIINLLLATNSPNEIGEDSGLEDLFRFLSVEENQNFIAFVVQLRSHKFDRRDDVGSVTLKAVDSNIQFIDSFSLYHLMSGEQTAFSDLLEVLPEAISESYLRITGESVSHQDMDVERLVYLIRGKTCE